MKSQVLWACSAAALLGMGALPQHAHGWGASSINGFGNGTAQVRVWCAPNAPPAAPSIVASASGFNPAAGLGPNIPGCNPLTRGSIAGGALWQWTTSAVAAGGDTVDDPSLFSLVTPTSPSASASLTVSGTIVSSSSALFSVTWSGSDPGTAQRLRWLAPSGAVLREEIRVGPWSQTLSVPISTPDFPIEELLLETCGVVTSVPSPGTCALGLASACVACLPRRRGR